MEIFASYTGPDFLGFYALMLATSIAAGLWLPAVLRSEGRSAHLSNPEEIAVLTGGANRHTHAVLSSLVANEVLTRAGTHKLRAARTHTAEGPAESAVMSIGTDFTLRQARKALVGQAERARAQLTRQGLLMQSGEHTRLSLIAALPYFSLFAIGLYRQQAGAALGEPTGFLSALLLVTVVLAAIRLFTVSTRTRAGQAAMRDLEASSSRLKRAPRQDEVSYAVAIFGTAVLVGTPWEPLHAVERAGSVGGDGGSSGGDSDGGGGCGGGCGGCGG